MESVYILIGNIESLIITPLIWLLFAAALIYFLWGATVMILNAGNEEERTKGKQHMIWGIVGMFIMVSAYAIISVLGNTFGF